MAVDQNQRDRRPHYHRGRRGPDRRGSDRRAAPTSETPARAADQVDVEQIMRDIRAKIAQRSGVELSTQQIQELAARRLEAILDPRNVSPSLMQQLRRGAAAAPDVPAPVPETSFAFEAETIYESHRGVLRFIRRLLNPLLKLFFNPTPLIHALHTQARLNREAAAREAERERVQMEWNALHYEIVQRVVTEVSRVSLEMQALTLRVESLAARVDFNDRRVRTLETSVPQGAPRPSARPAEPPSASAAAAPGVPPAVTPAETAGAEAPSAEGPRRRRRRRRGRRSGTAADAATTVVIGGSEGLAGPDTADLSDGDEGEEEESAIGASAETAAAADEPPDVAPSEPPSGLEAAGTDSGTPVTTAEASTSDTAAAPAPVASESAAPPDAAEEPHFPVREGLAQGAPPPPSPEPAPAAAEPEATPPPSAADSAAPSAPGPPSPQPTPPPDEPGPQPVPRDPGPPDR